MTDPLVRDISDTARWAAVYRARETARPDAGFRDPFARALAGERGERIAASHDFAEKNARAFVA
jgi:O-methyltransferase involved in polyketide biosynthesis